MESMIVKVVWGCHAPVGFAMTPPGTTASEAKQSPLSRVGDGASGEHSAWPSFVALPCHDNQSVRKMALIAETALSLPNGCLA